MRRHLSPILLAFALFFALVTSNGAPAFASDACTSGHNASNQAVYYCGVWVPTGGVPVYASTSQSSTRIDVLRSGGTVNWFFCSRSGGTATASGYTSTSWAYTEGDAHHARGYVPAVYFSGAENYWNGLPACDAGSSPGAARCNLGLNRGGNDVFYCPVWVPSGGIPMYASPAMSGNPVDWLYQGGSANWFECQQNGGTASAGGYTSSNWARTVGDKNNATGYVSAVYFTGAQNYWYGMSGCADPAPPPSDATCTAGHNPSGSAVYYCPVWLPTGGVPVYGSTSTSGAPVDHLIHGGSTNWFYCSVSGSTASVDGYTSSAWAKTLGDGNKLGYVPAIYFDGPQNYWPSLPKCGSGTGNPSPPPPPTGGGGGPTTSGTACGYSYSGVTTLTLKFMQQMCRVTVPSDPIYPYRIYSWFGGHGPTPGPTYGSCDASNGAPNDCHVDGFDCSGLVRWAYWETTGLDALDGNTHYQWKEALSLSPKAVIDGASSVGGYANINNYLSSLKPGDILFYGYQAGLHVAVYMGNGKQMNAFQSGDPDGITSVTTGDTFWGAVRMW